MTRTGHGWPGSCRVRAGGKVAEHVLAPADAPVSVFPDPDPDAASSGESESEVANPSDVGQNLATALAHAEGSGSGITDVDGHDVDALIAALKEGTVQLQGSGGFQGRYLHAGRAELRGYLRRFQAFADHPFWYYLLDDLRDAAGLDD